MDLNYSWVEKYRPSSLDDINGQNNVVESLKNVIHTKNIPNLIFFGPSGSGKNSTILSLAKKLFGVNYKERIIELNASDERGINVIREKIKTYAKQSVKTIKNAPPWKIIILDEADTMTTDSQFALRRIMEQYSKVTRFCIMCNYYNKIIDPIISRCSLFRFKPIEPDQIINKLNTICLKENYNCDIQILNKITSISRGDLRKAINLLQKCYNSNLNHSNLELLNDISGTIDEQLFNQFMDLIFEKKMYQVNKMIEMFCFKGYSLINQILLFHDYIIKSKLSTDHKSKIICKIVNIDQNLIKGCDEFIQYMNLAYYIMNLT